MKQTVEEAARKYACDIANKSPLGSVHYGNFVNMIENAYIQGAELQSKQSPWISVEERLPDNSDEVLTIICYRGRQMVMTNRYEGGRWKYQKDEIYTILGWMPIPPFDQILEANKDVLQRLKDK